MDEQVPDGYTDAVQMNVSPFGVTMPSTTARVPDVMTVPPLRIPVQIDYKLQEVVDSVMRGIEEARLNQGEFMTDADLRTDDDE